MLKICWRGVIVTQPQTQNLVVNCVSLRQFLQLQERSLDSQGFSDSIAKCDDYIFPKTIEKIGQTIFLIGNPDYECEHKLRLCTESSCALKRPSVVHPSLRQRGYALMQYCLYGSERSSLGAWTDGIFLVESVMIDSHRPRLCNDSKDIWTLHL
jgi:hypothetical protein